MEEQWLRLKSEIADLIDSLSGADPTSPDTIQAIDSSLDKCNKLLEQCPVNSAVLKEIKDAVVDLKVEKALVRRKQFAALKSNPPPPECAEEKVAATIKKKRHGYRIRKETSRFARFTGLQGFTHSRNTDTQVSRCFWIVLFVFGLSFTSYGVYTAVSDYFQYNTVTTGVSTVGQQVFPAVTVCNANRIHCANMLGLVEKCQKVH